ncbi:MAG: ABC transporter ATP-binding protein [Planctomycetaceae bacterium]|nr:ABC transporter ATP-binding protein [Planctomycetaceae bacterium]
MSEQENVIEIRNLSKVYRDFWGRKKVQAVKSLSLDVRKGEVFGLLGPNGSGKTTTIKMLLGLLFPTSGEISILGKKASDVAKNERIGYLPEESYLYRFLNADETLDFYGRLFNLSNEDRVRRADELIKMVGLNNARRRQLKEYSKGMTRRIGLAQALINDPELVLLDEPTSGLDPIGTREMKDLILNLKEQGKTVVLCSHQLADVQDVSDRIAVLFQGELKLMGDVDQLLELREETEIRTGNLSDAAIAEVEEVLKKHGMSSSDIKKPRVDLEELFLRTVRESGERPGRRFTAEEMAATQTKGDSEETTEDPAS